MTTVHKYEDKFISITKGAPEYLISRCSHIDDNGKIRPIKQEDLLNIDKANEDLLEMA